MNTFFFLLLTFYGICTVLSNKPIPHNLQECYKNENIWNFQLPMNLRVIIDIIRKVEKHSYLKTNIKIMSSSLLHKLKFDGVRYNEKVLSTNGILPFIADQPQRIKQEIIQEMIPGNPDLFPSDNLTLLEYCTLHQAISNTIWYHQLENENNFCIAGPLDRIIGRTAIKETKLCPKENGVILTRFGTVSLGNVINAIAASLKPQKIELNKFLLAKNQKSTEKQISEFEFDEDEVDLIVPRNQIILERSMWIKSLYSSTEELDNIWVATVAGELAEIVVYQGPKVLSEMSIGASGFWNSSMRPAIFYISNKRGFFEATRAEIIGSLDGLIIAKHLPSWIENFQNLKLSQILEMYYSNHGISFNKNIKACERGRNFIHIAPGTILEEQTFAVSKILAFRNGGAFMNDETLQRLVNYATNTFSYYVNNHVFSEVNCRKDDPQPRVEVFVAFDGAWSRDYTIDFLSVLVEDMDVSLFGSKMGLIHGSSGEWLFNLTNSPATVYENLRNLTKITWPRNLNYIAVLETIFNYLEINWKENEEKCKIGNIGQAIVVLSPLSRLNINDQRLASILIQKIKVNHPEIHFLYFVTDDNADVFRNFIISDEDRLIRSSNIGDISRLLSEVPVSLRPIVCRRNTGLIRAQLQDYISPQKSFIYKLHSQWRSNIKIFTLTVHGVGYGSMQICSWIKWKINDSQREYHCKSMTGFGDLIFRDYSYCSKDKNCPNIFYQVQKVTSLIKCTEIDCKSPDQVRFILRIDNLYSSNSQKIISKSNLLLFTLLLSLTFIGFK